MKEKLEVQAKRRQLEAEAAKLSELSKQEEAEQTPKIYSKVEDPYDLTRLSDDAQSEPKS
jgi:hypothetical protein